LILLDYKYTKIVEEKQSSTGIGSMILIT